jgi:hypothetical protein
MSTSTNIDYNVVVFCNESNKDLLISKIQTLKEEINRLTNSVSLHELQLSYMIENNLTVFDEKQLKTYFILKSLENQDLSLLEKAKQISALLK